MSSPAWVRIGLTTPSVACMASSDDQDVVAMTRPVSRLTSRDRPMQPSMAVTAGMTSSLT